MHSQLAQVGCEFATKGAFQSRDRDAFLFNQRINRREEEIDAVEFQSRDRDAFLFNDVDAATTTADEIVSISRSRCFSFQRKDVKENAFAAVVFQSRDRDAFLFNHYRSGTYATNFAVSISRSRCFSFQRNAHIVLPPNIVVSISRSRCFSFQQDDVVGRVLGEIYVSISRSRCFSFQLYRDYIDGSACISFNLAIEMLFFSTESKSCG